MPENVIFERLRKHYDQKLPFVAYRKPETSIRHRFFPGEGQLHTTNEFSESGFVFAPFDDEKPAILIPEEASEKAIFDTSEISFSGRQKQEEIILQLPKKRNSNISRSSKKGF